MFVKPFLGIEYLPNVSVSHCKKGPLSIYLVTWSAVPMIAFIMFQEVVFIVKVLCTALAVVMVRALNIVLCQTPRSGEVDIAVVANMVTA